MKVSIELQDLKKSIVNIKAMNLKFLKNSENFKEKLQKFSRQIRNPGKSWINKNRTLYYN